MNTLRIRQVIKTDSKKNALLLVYMLVIFSCSVTNKSHEPEDVLAASSWVLHSLKGEPIQIEAFGHGAPHVKFGPAHTLAVFTGCEYTTGNFAMAGLSLDLQVDSTRVICSTPASENFIRFLNTSNRFLVAKERLLLLLDSTELMSLFPK